MSGEMRKKRKIYHTRINGRGKERMEKNINVLCNAFKTLCCCCWHSTKNAKGRDSRWAKKKEKRKAWGIRRVVYGGAVRSVRSLGWLLSSVQQQRETATKMSLVFPSPPSEKLWGKIFEHSEGWGKKGKSTKEEKLFGIARAMRSSFVIRRESCPSLGRINFGIALLVLRWMSSWARWSTLWSWRAIKNSFWISSGLMEKKILNFIIWNLSYVNWELITWTREKVIRKTPEKPLQVFKKQKQTIVTKIVNWKL